MAKEEKKKVKRPTAQKRDIRNDKRRLINKSFKTGVRSTMRAFESACKEQDKEGVLKALSEVYCMIDLGVKRGVYKPNKANRVKARSAAKVAALSS